MTPNRLLLRTGRQYDAKETFVMARCRTTRWPMRLLLRLFLLVAISAATPALAQPRDCPAAGTKIHWIADYCMSKLETDDEIAASSCIGAEAARVFGSDCVAKVYYKKAMCQLAVSRKQRQGEINSCIADKTFMGSTVRNGGVGGG